MDGGQNSLLSIILEKYPRGKNLLGKPSMRWEDLIRKNISALGGGSDWKDRASDKDGWRDVCLAE